MRWRHYISCVYLMMSATQFLFSFALSNVRVRTCHIFRKIEKSKLLSRCYHVSSSSCVHNGLQFRSIPLILTHLIYHCIEWCLSFICAFVTYMHFTNEQSIVVVVILQCFSYNFWALYFYVICLALWSWNFVCFVLFFIKLKSVV